MGAVPAWIGLGDWSVKEDAVQNKKRVMLSRHRTALDKSLRWGNLVSTMDVAEFKDQLNRFLHRQNVRKLTPAERELAKTWCMDLIHREHPDWSDEQAERFYENLINVRVIAVDEWSRRME
jgi:hypothetical protein